MPRRGVIGLLLVACTGTVSALDGGTPDASVPDAGAPDAGAFDAGAIDAGGLDAGDFDAGSVDAGTSDAGPTDAGAVDAGSADAGGCAALLCEDFEGPVLDGGIWTLVAGYHTDDLVTVDSTLAAHGQNSALATIE